MSVSSDFSAQKFSAKILEQIKFEELEQHAQVIEAVTLREFVLGELERAKSGVGAIQKAFQISSSLPDAWVENKVTVITSNLPKDLPLDCGFGCESDSILFLHIFKEVREALTTIKRCTKPIEQNIIKRDQTEKEIALEQALFKEQEDLHSNPLFCLQIKNLASFLKERASPKIFIAYSWPLPDPRYQDREAKVQEFLRILETHLRLLGMNPKLDVKHCSKGEDIYHYINKKITKADTVLFFGTGSLLVKHEECRGIPIVCRELNKALGKIEEATKKKKKSLRPKILPVLLTGNMETSFPANFKGHLNTLLLPETGYYEGIKTLVYTLYGFKRLGVTKDSFADIWKEKYQTIELQAIHEAIKTKREEILWGWKEKFPQNEEKHRAEDTTSNFGVPLSSDLNPTKEENERISQLNARINSLINDLKKQKKATKEAQGEQQTLQDKVNLLNEELQTQKILVLNQAKKIELLQAGSKKALPDIAFGKADWERHFGGVGEEPSLPLNIEEILKSPCPFWPDKRVGETHILTLIPQTVNGVPLTLDSLSKLIKAPKHGLATQYRRFYEGVQKEYGKQSVSSSHWLLLTKEVIPNSRGRAYADQCALIANEEDYEVPHLLDAAASILMQHTKTGERLYSSEPSIYTRCHEKIKGRRVVVGGFSPGGLDIDYYCSDGSCVGVGGSRKF